MSRSASWGEFEWGEAEWGSVEAEGLIPPTATLALAGAAPLVLPVTLAPGSGALVVAGLAPTVAATGGTILTPLVGQLSVIGAVPIAFPSFALQTVAGSVVLLGVPPELERSDENQLGFQWAVLTPADLPLGFRWTVLPVVVAGGELGFTWVVVAESPTLGFTWHVVPAEIFELFESAGVGAAAGIGEDVLLPVGRVTRE
jgi:hypothetical protein